MPGVALASMGIYVFEADVLVKALEDDAGRDSKHDFGKDILPSLIGHAPVYSYRFSDENKKANKYWRDIGELDAYYEANIGPRPGQPGLQPVRPGMAHPHVDGAGAASQSSTTKGAAARRLTPSSRQA